MDQPFYWKARKGWYLNGYVDGKRHRVRLADTKQKAFDKWKALLAENELEELRQHTQDPLIADVLDRWIAVQQSRLDRGEISPLRFDRISSIVRVFLSGTYQSWESPEQRLPNATLSVAQLTPAVFQEWCASRKITANTEATELALLKSALRWAKDDAEMCVKAPLIRAKAPRSTRREEFVDKEDHRRFVEACGQNRFCRKSVRSFRQLLIASFHTGCRPGELRLLRWDEIDADMTRAVQMRHKTSRKTGKARTIYFSACMQTLLKLIPRKSEYVFVNSLGKPWSSTALVRRMRRLRETTGSKSTAYAYRHGFVTRAIVAGVDSTTVAELVGHASVEMIARVYGHLDRQVDHLHQATAKIASSTNIVSTNTPNPKP